MEPSELQVYNEIIKMLMRNITEFLLPAMFAVFVGLWIKEILETVVDYFTFRGGKAVGLNKAVSVDGFEGVIADFTLTRIIIESKKGFYIVPIKGWRNHKWIFLKSDICDGKSCTLTCPKDINSNGGSSDAA